MKPSTGVRPADATSAVSRLAVPRPQAYGNSGSAAASASPAASPTELSTADDTTTGRPTAVAIRSAAHTPPSGATLITAMSAAPASATRAGSSARRMDSSAAMGVPTCRRTCASSSSDRQGCSTYSRPPAAASRTSIAATAWAGVHAPLASTLIRPVGPRAARTAATRSASAASVTRGSATLTFAVRQPDASTSSAARAGDTTGTVVFTSTRSRSRSGHRLVAESTAARSHGTHSVSS